MALGGLRKHFGCQIPHLQCYDAHSNQYEAAGSDENRADVRDFLLGYCRMTDVVVTGQCLIQPGRIRRSEMRTELVESEDDSGNEEKEA